MHSMGAHHQQPAVASRSLARARDAAQRPAFGFGVFRVIGIDFCLFGLGVFGMAAGPRSAAGYFCRASSGFLDLHRLLHGLPPTLASGPDCASVPGRLLQLDGRTHHGAFGAV